MKSKILDAEDMPEFQQSIDQMADESRIFVDKAMAIAACVVDIMEQKGIKQNELAARLGKSEAEVSRWLSGIHNFTLRSLSKLEAALGCEIITTPPAK